MRKGQKEGEKLCLMDRLTGRTGGWQEEGGRKGGKDEWGGRK